MGDEVLRIIATRIASNLRGGGGVDSSTNANLGPDISLARAGGDEFLILLPDILCWEDLAIVAQRISDAVKADVEIVGSEIPLSASIGLVYFPTDVPGERELTRLAENAMHHAKRQDGDNIRWHSEDTRQLISQRLEREVRLCRSVGNGELELYYQPRVSLTTGRAVSVEALLRWNDPLSGLVPTLEFIPLAEETGLILPIGAWVLDRACADVKDWERQDVDVGVSINLSPLQFRTSSIVSDVEGALSRTGLNPNRVELEVTETAFMEDSEASRKMMSRFAEMGVRLAIDDFGTGYSCMSYLKQFPIDTLKIDRCFVRDLPSDKDDAAIVRAIVGLGGSFNLSLVAEGVETDEQASFLLGIGCDEAQGYLYCRPLPESEFLDWMSTREKYPRGSSDA